MPSNIKIFSEGGRMGETDSIIISQKTPEREQGAYQEDGSLNQIMGHSVEVDIYKGQDFRNSISRFYCFL